MLRLSTFSLLLALATAQNGYEYNRPVKPFGPGTSSSRPTGPASSYPTTTPFAVRPHTDNYGSSTPGYSSGLSNFPTGSGYPGSTSQRPQSGFPGSSHPGQGPSGPSSNYPGQIGPYQGPSGPSNNFPSLFNPNHGSRPSGNFHGGPSAGFSGSRYPGANGVGHGHNGFGPHDTGAYEGGDYSAIPGQPGVDYPVLSDIPHTSFSCNQQAYPGYYADVETRCQVFHVCANNKTYDFLCPNGTVFSQEFFVCVWWDQFDCNSAPGLYGLNANLYDYSIVGSSDSFPGFNRLQGPSSTYPGRRPQGSNFPGTSSRPQTSSTFPGSTGPHGPTIGFSTSPRPQGPSTGHFGGPSTGYPGISGPQGILNYPGSTEPHGPSTIYPGNTGLQGPSTYPGNSSPGYTGSTYPGNSGLHGPSTSFPGTRGPASYPGTSGPGYPGTGSISYPGSSNYPVGNQGYPSGKPSGPGFPIGNGGRPQQPNREYLPPRN